MFSLLVFCRNCTKISHTEKSLLYIETIIQYFDFANNIILYIFYTILKIFVQLLKCYMGVLE